MQYVSGWAPWNSQCWAWNDVVQISMSSNWLDWFLWGSELWVSYDGVMQQFFKSYNTFNVLVYSIGLQLMIILIID